jgi:cation:H+ antiporter
MTTVVPWLELVGAAAIILGAATFLAKSADVIAYKTGLGRAFIGVVLLATATSLPELGTGVGSVVLVGEPDLAAGDAFGSNLFNLLIIGLLDMFWRNGPILTSVSRTSILIGSLGIAVISIAAFALLVHTTTATISGWYVSPISLVLPVVFVAALYLIYRAGLSSEESAEDKPQDEPAEDHEYASHSLPKAAATYLVAAAVVVGAAIWLAQTGDRIAEEMGWEASFVGNQFLALSTSLPELAASFAAIRINAPELAITNLLGSNLFNMGFILFIDDLAYSQGVFWASISEIHILSALVALIMTAVVIVALVTRPRDRPSRLMTGEGLLLIGLYVVASALVFYLG